MRSVKATITNWINENQRLALVIAGAVGLPLVLGLGAAIVVLVANIFMWFGLSPAVALLITSLMTIGAIGGYLAYGWLDDND